MGGKLSRPVYLAPHPPEYQSTHFKLAECDDVSIINIIQVKFSCFLCYIVSYTIQYSVKYAKKTDTLLLLDLFSNGITKKNGTTSILT